MIIIINIINNIIIIIVFVKDVDDDRLSGDVPQRSPFSRYSVDIAGRDAFWDRQSRPEEGSRGGLPNVDGPPPAGKPFGGGSGDLKSPPSLGQQQQQGKEKPRIWSLADVATSTTTASGAGRRSPSQPVDAAAVRPPLLPSLPPPHPALRDGFQPWTNGIAGYHQRHCILPPPPHAASSSSPPASHRPLPPVANGLLRYAPYPVVVGGPGHPSSHVAVSHQLAAAAVAHAVAVNAAVQARLQPPISGPGDPSLPSAAVGRSLSPTLSNWTSVERHAAKNSVNIIIRTGIVA